MFQLKLSTGIYTPINGFFRKSWGFCQICLLQSVIFLGNQISRTIQWLKIKFVSLLCVERQKNKMCGICGRMYLIMRMRGWGELFLALEITGIKFGMNMSIIKKERTLSKKALRRGYSKN